MGKSGGVGSSYTIYFFSLFLSYYHLFSSLCFYPAGVYHSAIKGYRAHTQHGGIFLLYLVLHFLRIRVWGSAALRVSSCKMSLQYSYI